MTYQATPVEYSKNMGEKVVILPNWVGDFLMAFCWLDEILETQGVFLCGKPHFFELIRGKYPSSIWVPKYPGFSGFFRTVKALFNTSAYEAILLPNSISSALLATVSGMKKITGRPTDGRFFLLTKKVYVEEELHQSEIYRKILEAGGLKVKSEAEANIYLAHEDIQWAQDFVRERFGERPLFAIHPGASKKERRWPVSRFAEIAVRASKKGYAVVVVGSGLEKSLGDYICSQIPGDCYNVAADNLSLGKLAALISKCEVFLGNDSGPAHIAAACGLKVVVIYGPGSPAKTSPVLNRKAQFSPVTLNFPCSPCRERFFKDCEPVEGVPPCIWEISVEMVWNRVREYL